MDDAPPVGDAETTLGSDPLGEDPLTGEIPCCVSLCLGVVDIAVEGPLTMAPLDTGDTGSWPVREVATSGEVCVSGTTPAP